MKLETMHLAGLGPGESDERRRWRESNNQGRVILSIFPEKQKKNPNKPIYVYYIYVYNAFQSQVEMEWKNGIC